MGEQIQSGLVFANTDPDKAPGDQPATAPAAVEGDALAVDELGTPDPEEYPVAQTGKLALPDQRELQGEPCREPWDVDPDDDDEQGAQ